MSSFLLKYLECPSRPGVDKLFSVRASLFYQYLAKGQLLKIMLLLFKFSLFILPSHFLPSGVSIYGFFEENINNVKNTIDNTFYTSCLACTVMVTL